MTPSTFIFPFRNPKKGKLYVDMPRKNPLAKREQDICGRIRAFRKKMMLSQVDFARILQIDSTLLSAIEHFRAPLRYGLAWKIIDLYRIEPRWLATGEGPLLSNAKYSVDQESLEKNSLKLFSLEYDEVLSKSLAPKKDKTPIKRQAGIEVSTDVDGRVAAEYWLRSHIKDWFEKVPANKLNLLINKLIDTGENLLASWPSLSPKAREKIKRDVAERRTEVETRRRLLGR